MKKYEYNYGKNPEGILSTISGYATETTNFGETAFGILNKSTRDKSNFTTPEVVSSSTATLFSVGNGSDGIRKNIIELKADGSTFINGVGGYDGTNSDSATSLSDTLQNISSSVEGDYLPLTGGEITEGGDDSLKIEPFGILIKHDMAASQTASWRMEINSNATTIGDFESLPVSIEPLWLRLSSNGLSLYDNGTNKANYGPDGILFYEHDQITSLEIYPTGIHMLGKSENDLLNAGGSTTSVSDIVTQVQAAIVDQAPETLDTLNELAAALGDDPNFATTIANQIAQKADKTVATSSTDGLMSASDKKRLDNSIYDFSVSLHSYDNGATGSIDDGLLFGLDCEYWRVPSGSHKYTREWLLPIVSADTNGVMSIADKAKLDNLSTNTNHPADLDVFTSVQTLWADDGSYVTLQFNKNNTLTGESVTETGSTLYVANLESSGFMSAADKTKLDQITITEGDIVASGFRITDGTANEVLTADGDSNTLKTINGQTLLGSGDVDMSEFATQNDLDEYLLKSGGTVNYLTLGDPGTTSGGYNLNGSGIHFNRLIILPYDTGYITPGSPVYMNMYTNNDGKCGLTMGVTGNYTEYSTEGIKIHDKTSNDLLNAGGSTISIDDLKTQVAPDLSSYATKSEVNAKVSGTGVSSIQVVTTLPDVQEEGVLYIVTGEEA